MNSASESSETKDAERAKELTRQERAIQKGQKAFLDSAKAVWTIVKNELFKPKFKNKSEYFSERWDMSASDITRYTNAGRVLELLEAEDFDEFPTNEGQARALADVGEGKQVEVWRKVLDSGQKLSARLIKETASPPAESGSETGGESAASEEAGGADIETQESATRSTKCTAVITVEIDSTVLADALDYSGVPCNKVGDDKWQFQISADTKSDIFMKLAGWSKVYSVTKAVITFA